jgi:hypothetical protein
MFPQESSPLIISGTGERRAGRTVGQVAPPRPTSNPAASPPDVDPNATAESM